MADKDYAIKLYTSTYILTQGYRWAASSEVTSKRHH